MSNDVINEVELQRRVRELDTDIQPQRDLWPAIERGVMASGNHSSASQLDRGFTLPRSLVFGVAASVVMAALALVLSIAQFQLDARGDDQRLEMAHHRAFMGEGLALMSYQSSVLTSELDPATRAEIFESLAVLVQARAALYEQIQASPDDLRLREMLVKVQAQERALLALEFGRQPSQLHRASL